MRLYWEVAVRGFRRYATYRGATVAGIFTNTVFGFILGYVRLALYRDRDVIEGYTAQDIITYTFVVQGLLMVVHIWGWVAIVERIRSGDVATDLSRPWDFQFYWMAQDSGRALYHLVFRGIPPFLVGAWAFTLRLPSEPAVAVAFALSVTLAVWASYAFRFILNLSAFWLLDERGPLGVGNVLWMVFGGFVVPIHFFPGPLRAVAGVLPFRAMCQIPVDVFLQKVTGADLVGVLAFQALWMVALLALGRLLLAAAVQRVVIQGG